jgi:hypothetical protein
MRQSKQTHSKGRHFKIESHAYLKPWSMRGLVSMLWMRRFVRLLRVLSPVFPDYLLHHPLQSES